MTGCQLSERACIPCKGDVPALGTNEQQQLLRQLPPEWNIANGHHLEKTFRFPDFESALDFTNRAGRISEKQQHHPEITLAWGSVAIRIWTHTIDGLTENDFILAATIDAAQ